MTDQPDLDLGDPGRSPSGRSAGRNVRVVIGSDLDDLVAVKTASNPVAIVAVEREALVLGQLRHPNVVELLRTERGPGTASLVTQFAGRSTLAQVRPTDAATVGRLGASLLTIVAEIHSLGWVHGRMTPDHCIVGPNGQITLCAFGAAHRVEPGDARRTRELADAIGIVAGLADGVSEPADRAARRRLRRLHSLLAVDPAAITPATVERLRTELSELGGSAAVIALPPDAPTERRSGAKRTIDLRDPSSDTTRPRRAGRRNWRGVVAGLATLGLLFGAVAFLRWIGGPLGDPLTNSSVSRIGAVPHPIALALSILRIAAFAACMYGIALTSATLAAILTRRPDLERLATSMAPPRLRRALVGLIGLGVLSSVASAPAGPPPVTVRTAPARHVTRATSAPDTTMPPAPDTTAPDTTAPDTTTSTTVPPLTTSPTTAPATAAGDRTTAPTDGELPNLWVMEPGDHLWRVASVALGRHLGRDALTSEVDSYWRAVIDLNRESLIDPDNPDLVFTGQVIELPPFP